MLPDETPKPPIDWNKLAVVLGALASLAALIQFLAWLVHG